MAKIREQFMNFVLSFEMGSFRVITVIKKADLKAFWQEHKKENGNRQKSGSH